MEQQDSTHISDELKSHIIILGAFLVAMWLSEMFDWIIGGRLDYLGIMPRQLVGLRGIILAPFLHVGAAHLIANTIPFLVLGWFVMLRSVRTFFTVTLIVILVSGLGTWLVGPANSIHVGASGLIFGYFGYLVLRGYFERSWQAILWSVLVLFLYGSMLLGIFPQQFGVSWQSHLFGFVGGGLAAYWLSPRRR